MIYRGQVKNGVVVLQDNVNLPEGMQVKVEPVEVVRPGDGPEPPTLYERLKPAIGIIRGLPPDFAKNHDHYIHGQPKK
jgi:hypothetical protein